MCRVCVLGKSSVLSWNCRKAAVTSAQNAKGGVCGEKYRTRHGINWAAVGDVAGDAGGCQNMPEPEVRK